MSKNYDDCLFAFYMGKFGLIWYVEYKSEQDITIIGNNNKEKVFVFKGNHASIINNLLNIDGVDACLAYFRSQKNILLKNEQEQKTQKFNYGDTMFVIDYEYERVYCEQVTIIGHDKQGNVFYNSLRESECYENPQDAYQVLNTIKTL